MVTKIHPVYIGSDEAGGVYVIVLDTVFIPSLTYHAQGAHYLKQILVDAFGWYLSDEEFLQLMRCAGYQVKGDKVRCRISKKIAGVREFLRGHGK